MRHSKLGSLDVSRIGLGAMGMSAPTPLHAYQRLSRQGRAGYQLRLHLTHARRCS